MQRHVQVLGYRGFLAVAVEALCRAKETPCPPNVYADDVWKHDLPQKLKGKTYAITGSSRGMGFELANRIAERGGNVILLNRNGSHAEKAREDVQRASSIGGGTVVLISCDLCDFESVRSAAAEVRKESALRGWQLDCLVLNAGLMAQGDVRTKDGFDIQMQANHLSHFLLTSLLFDLLEKAAAETGEARVVNHTSGARNMPNSPLQEDAFEKSWAEQATNPCAGDAKTMAKWQRYQQSKRANLAFTYALADLISARGTKVKSLCAHPGACNSGLQSRTEGGSFLDNFINGLAAASGHSTGDGCLGIALGAVKEGVAIGDLFGPTDFGCLKGKAVLSPSEREANYSEQQLRMLWDKSLLATGAKW